MSLSSLEKYLLLIIIYFYISNFVLISTVLRKHNTSSTIGIIRNVIIDIFMAFVWIVFYPVIVYKVIMFVKEEAHKRMMIKMLREVANHERRKKQSNETQGHGRSNER